MTFSLPGALRLLSTICVLSAASVASADSLKISTNASSNGGNGGSYTIKVFNGPVNNLSYSPLAILSAGTFESFCLEPTEYFTNGSTYNYTVGIDAIGGANENSTRNIGAGDRLSLGTSWLYSLFATGVLTNFDYGTGRQASNLLLQRAFWYLEDDYTGYSDPVGSNIFLNMVKTQFGSLSAGQANVGATGAYGVKVLNLTSGTNNENNHQSQLYFTKVPDEGATLLLLAMGLSALLAAVGTRGKRNASR